MFRVLLLVAMIYQVLGCPYACMATHRAGESHSIGCRCCQAKRAAHNRDDHTPPANGERESHTGCFCNSPVKVADSVQANHELVSSPIWTIIETQPQLSVESVAMVSSEFRPPSNDAGIGLRLAVQSLLL